MDNSIITALIAAGSAFAGVVGGGISNYLVNKNIEKRKLTYQRREELFEELSIFKIQIRMVYDHYCNGIEIDIEDKYWSQNKKTIHPYLKIDHIISLYFQELKKINDSLSIKVDKFIMLATNHDKSIDPEWKKSELKIQYIPIRDDLITLQNRTSRMK